MEQWIIRLLLILFCSQAMAQSFRSDQMRYPRVRQAYNEKEDVIKTLFAEKQLVYPPSQIYLRLFKETEKLEVWVDADSTVTDSFQLLKTYPICYFSGLPGPKCRQGDLQLPEGFYHIDRFNPASSFHLSLGINYPNEADRRRCGGGNLGGDIFIHGDCVSIGCAAMTDDLIKEIYILAVEARSQGQNRIPVHIFPAKMTPVTIAELNGNYGGNNVLLSFWENIQEGYTLFEETRRLPRIRVDKEGRYDISLKVKAH